MKGGRRSRERTRIRGGLIGSCVERMYTAGVRSILFSFCSGEARTRIGRLRVCDLFSASHCTESDPVIRIQLVSVFGDQQVVHKLVSDDGLSSL
jgi:hypothetical protein